VLAKSGEWRWILDRGKVVARDPVTHAPLRLTGTHTDITARKHAEKEAGELQRTLQESQRLESLGLLAGGVAHDFNNLLTVIIGHTTLVKLDHAHVPETVDHLDKVVLAANRAADLCRQLLAYAGKGAMSMEQLSVKELLRDTAHHFNHSLNPRTTLDLTLAPNLPLVEADPSQFQQIIMNLLLNAAEAIGENTGQIRLQTERVELIRGELIDARPSADIPAGTYVLIEVGDTGCGMSPDTLRQVFDPFFTTKFTGRGLGLPAVLGIVRSLRGALTVRSTLGRGSLIRIYLPALPERPALAFNRGASATSTPPTGTAVLVAADEADLRTLLGELLQHAGYEPVLVPDAKTACTQYAATPQRFAAVLLDLPPTPLDCRATLQRMQSTHPEVRGVLITDLSERDVRARTGYDTFAAVLQKPFTPESLKACLLRATNRA
ncbi:MAG: ATP-binding protein, partial [Candidatus Didemnitutus sp.]|nr:ATP-binding protein [Candidatus Didemnitutus sp.]